MSETILRIDASARREGSTTRSLTDRLVSRLVADAGATVVTRDLTEALPQLTEDWIGANFTEADARSAAQREILALSDHLVSELKAADTVVIGVPVYNFGVASALKAWVDLVARARVTFRYTEAGPEGLLAGKRAILVVASGGTPVGADVDFATGYMRHVLGFMGITDVTVVDAGLQMVNTDAIAQATQRVDAIAPVEAAAA